jgi:hypothetical protein
MLVEQMLEQEHRELVELILRVKASRMLVEISNK